MTEPQSVPSELKSTYDMLKRAYPDRIPDEDYHAVLKVLSQETSFRPLADVMGLFFPNRTVYNDVLAISGNYVVVETSDLERVERRLNQHGLGEWLAEPS